MTGPKTQISDAELEAIEVSLREKYRTRIEEKGPTPEGLFWDSTESMNRRFEAATELVDLEGASVLDVGCGFGDFYGYLRETGTTPEAYHGVDVSEVVLDEARDRYSGDEHVSFERRNFLLDPIESTSFDVAVLFGALGHRLESIDNEAYIRRFMRTCYACAETVILNALSQYRQGDWDYEEFVYYYDPGKVFGYAQELTRDVRLRHDIEPIPQKEFILVLTDDGSSDRGDGSGVADLED